MVFGWGQSRIHWLALWFRNLLCFPAGNFSFGTRCNERFMKAEFYQLQSILFKNSKTDFIYEVLGHQIGDLFPSSLVSFGRSYFRSFDSFLNNFSPRDFESLTRSIRFPFALWLHHSRMVSIHKLLEWYFRKL